MKDLIYLSAVCLYYNLLVKHVLENCIHLVIMGKRNKAKGDLGRALLRDRFGSSRSRGKGNGESSMLHTADIDDGYKWDRLNLKSVTEQSSFQEFLSTAQLAGTEFHAEKLNIKFVNPNSGIGILSDKEKDELLEKHSLNKGMLKIPRRPKWDESTSPGQLRSIENEQFLEWRKNLAVFQEAQGLTMTPYEKNLEFWRQLWRVVERSDVIVQIVDARNPLLFRCEDLELYVKEINPDKMNVILVNKADFLTTEQRQIWADYFCEIGVQVAFFSATLSAEETLEQQKSLATDARDACSNDKDSEIRARESDINDNDNDNDNDYVDVDDSENANSAIERTSAPDTTNDSLVTPEKEGDCLQDEKSIKNSSEILNREKLISLFKSMYTGPRHTKGITTVGLVGYPNVGKSSTINALLMDKKVSVSATPGKTKHFQTLFVDEQLLLCDCPGLVMPSFVCTKADMVLNGILPIDHLRDHVPSVTLVGTLIPRHIIEDVYGLMLPMPLEGEDPDRPPTAEEILNTYGYNRGFMTQNGQPDNPRSARYLLKDFVNGKLLYCVAPPNRLQSEFHKFPPRRKIPSTNKVLPPRAVRAGRGVATTGQDVDKLFFRDRGAGIHVRGAGCVSISGQRFSANPRATNQDDVSLASSTQGLTIEDKPWKKINKHANKKKREKTRRLYAHLDQH